MALSKTFGIPWPLIQVMLMVLVGIDPMETAEVGRIKDKNDFTIAQKRAVVQEMTYLQLSLSPTLIKMDGGIKVETRE